MTNAEEPTPAYRTRLERLKSWLTKADAWPWNHLRACFASVGGGLRSIVRNRRLRRVLLVGGRDAVAALAIALGVLGVGRFAFERIEPGTVGVRQNNWGSDREITREDFNPGIHLGPRLFDSWHRVDTRTHVLSFARKHDSGDHPPIEVRTPQGPTAQLAVHVPYRVIPGEAHMLVEEGIKTAYPMRVKSTVENVLVQELSKLDTSALCDPLARRAASEAALARINTELAPLHVRAEGVFVGAVYFAPGFEKKMQEKQLAEQTKHTNQVLHDLKIEHLENDSQVQAVEQAKAAKIAEASRGYAAEKELWEQRRIGDQKIEIELLEQELAQEKQLELARLTRELEEARQSELDAPLEEHGFVHHAALLRIARERQSLEDELGRGRSEAARAAVSALATLRADHAVAREGFAREEQAEGARLDLALSETRGAGEQALREIVGAAEARAGKRRREADAVYAALAAEGERALAAAETLRNELEAGALSLPGARMVLAQEAATNLNLNRVALDSNDPRVPSVLDLDALVALLVGEDG